jgi:hypothetical protein
VVRPALGLTHASSITPLTHHEREQTRGGIADCAWADLTERDDIDALSDAELVRGIERHCDWGWRAFFVTPPPPWAPRDSYAAAAMLSTARCAAAALDDQEQSSERDRWAWKAPAQDQAPDAGSRRRSLQALATAERASYVSSDARPS